MGSREYVSFKQGLHTPSSLLAYCPATQVVHVRDFGWETDPLPHGQHLAEATPEYVPAGQILHTLAPAADHVPA